MNSALTSVRLAKLIRLDVLKMVSRAGASHVGSCLSCADILSVLYNDIMDIDCNDHRSASRDRFILSKGHAAAALYATLANVGIISPEKLLTYGEDLSPFMTHASHVIPGVEYSSGSLGHGLPFASGKSLAAKLTGRPWRTFVLLSDGELNSGSNWEAFLFSAHHRLDQLIAIVDYNKLQGLGAVNETMRIEPLAEKLRAFGWAVREVDGHNHSELSKVLRSTPWEVGKPCALIAHTVKGKGVSFMENKLEWHYRSLDALLLEKAVRELEVSCA